MVNMYKEGDVTHFGQHLTSCNIEKCWNQVIEQSDYYHRKIDVEQYNRLVQSSHSAVYLS